MVLDKWKIGILQEGETNKLNIRRAEEKDIERIMELLKQVLTIHAHIRPDIFIDGTTKYTKEELMEIINDDNRPIYVRMTIRL